MAKFEGLALVNHPRDLVFETTRDALAESVRHVDDIDRIVEERRFASADGIIEITNTWYGKTPIPSVIEAVIKPHHLVWTDHALWTTDDHTCRWRAVSEYFPDHLHCIGATRFHATASPERTNVTIEGTILVDPKGAPAVPEAVARHLAHWLEEFVGAMFPWALRKVMDGVSRTIEERAARHPR